MRKTKSKRGLFITVEGVEGSGKTTQLAKIIGYLNSTRMPVYATREPGGTEIADQIRKILVEPHREELDPMAELLLYNAARIQHLRKVIGPKLAEGTTVVCDRYVDSTVAYQAYGHGIPLDIVNRINNLATGGLLPDLTILLDCDPKVGLTRSLKRLTRQKSAEGRFEKKGVPFHRRVRKGFLEIAKRNKKRVVVVNAGRGTGEIFEEIQKKLCPLKP